MRGTEIKFSQESSVVERLARAYAESENSDKSMAAYRDFLEVWKNADSDVPIFKEATLKYTKLKGKNIAASN